MKYFKKITALLLALVICASVFTASMNVSAKDREYPEASEKAGWNFLNSTAQALLKGICAIYPNPASWKPYSQYDSSEFFMPGRSGYSVNAAETGEWSLGYSKKSIVPEDFEPGKYYMGRKLNVISSGTAAKVQSILDDQLVRAVCIDDNSGRGKVVMAVIDGMGLSSNEVHEIRIMLGEFAKQHNIVSINVSVTHTHSGIDTQGVSASFLYHLFASSPANLFGLKKLPFTDNEQRFMANLRAKTVEAIKEACLSMEAGSLTYKTVDGSDYIKDKLYPISYVTDIASLHFIPADGSDETYLINMACHPTSFSYKNETLSSDYIYYMDEEFNKDNCNMIFFQGAVGQISRENSKITVPESDDPYIEVKTYGKAIARLILDDEGEETALSPVINAKHEEFLVNCSNYLLLLACKCGLAGNVGYTNGLGQSNIVLPTEIGYVDFGGKVAFALYPAELYPEIVIGGAISADKSWDGTDWTYRPMTEMVADGIDMYSVCFANDAIGYVVTDNDFAFIAHEPDELLSAGKYTASTIVKAFEKLMQDVYPVK